MDRLQTHPLVVAKGINIKRIELAHLHIDERPVFHYSDIILLRLDTSTSEHVAVVGLHECLPFVLERFISSVHKFGNQLVQEEILHMVIHEILRRL